MFKMPNVKVIQELDGCSSRPFLMRRWYDSQWKEWSEWEYVEGRELRDKYGETPEEWKKSCLSWIRLGGTYEYRIGVRTERTDWSVSFKTDPGAQD